MASIRATQLKSIVDHRLRQNGIDPVDVPIKLDQDCGDVHGYYTGEHVALCDDADAHTLFHEVGHAWTDRNLSDSGRERVAQEMGLPSWNDPDDPYFARANERASFVFAQRMMGTTTQGTPVPEEYERYWRAMTTPPAPDHLQTRKGQNGNE